MMGHVSWVRQLALAVALFVLGSFAFWLEYKQKPAKEAQEEQTKKVFPVKDTPIGDIKLGWLGKAYELSCLDLSSNLCKAGDNSRWELKQPSKLRADDTNANSLVSSLQGLNAIETIDLKDETPEKRAALLKEYGLDAEARGTGALKTVTVQTPKQETTLYIGQPHPLGTGNFALVAVNGKPDESKVFLIPPYFVSNFEHDLTYWRDKKLLTIDSHEVAAFTLQSKKAGKIEGIRKDSAWTLKTKEGEFAGDIENIDSLLAGASFLMAKNFVSDNKADAKSKAALKGTQPILTLTLQKQKSAAEKEEPAPITLRIFGKPEKSRNPKAPAFSRLYATASNTDPLAELDLSAKDRLDKTIKDLRLTKLITSMERFTARRLSFSGKPIGAEPVTLVTTDGVKWAFEKSKEEANSEKVQGTLEKLSGNRIKEFIDLSKSGSKIAAGEKNGIEFTLGDEKNPVKRRYLFWKYDGLLYARDLLSKRNEAFGVDNAVAEGLPWEPNYYKKAK